MVKFPRKVCIVCSGLGKVNLTPASMEKGASQCSSWVNGVTSCWCFQGAISSLLRLKALRHLVSDVVSIQTCL